MTKIILPILLSTLCNLSFAQWHIINTSSNHYSDMEIFGNKVFFSGSQSGESMYTELDMVTDDLFTIIHDTSYNALEIEVLSDSLAYAFATYNHTFLKINPSLNTVEYEAFPHWYDGTGDLLFINDSTGFLSYQDNGSALYRTFDYGQNWIELFDTSLNLVPNGILGGRDLLFEKDTLYAVTGAGYLYSPNLGNTWFVRDIPNNNGSYFSIDKSGNKIICAGIGYSPTLGSNYGTIAISNDYGMTWDFYENHKFKNFNDVNIANDSVIYVVGRAQGDLYNILKTIDGGSTWHPQWFSTTPSLHYPLRKIRCINEDTCYVCGDYGFIAKTSNGGGPFLDMNIEEQLSSDVKVFPNPTHQTLSITSVHLIEQVEIYNSKGEHIAQYRIANYEKLLSTDQLPSGFYLLKIRTTEGIMIRKFQKL